MSKALMVSLAAVFAAGCSGASTKAETATSAKVEPPKAPATPVPPAPPVVAKPVDTKPVAADLSKSAFPTENAELFGFNDGEGHLFWYTNGTITNTVNVPADGEYQIVITASCQEAQGQKAKFKLSVDGQAVGGETTLTAAESKDYAFAAPLKAGARKVGVEFTNDMYKQDEYDLNLYVQAIALKRTK